MGTCDEKAKKTKAYILLARQNMHDGASNGAYALLALSG